MLTLNYHGKKIRLSDRMLSLLQYAMKNPNRWHRFGPDEDGIEAAKRLEKTGLVEICEYSSHYRINPKF
jgi:hypothetical protein